MPPHADSRNKALSTPRQRHHLGNRLVARACHPATGEGHDATLRDASPRLSKSLNSSAIRPPMPPIASPTRLPIAAPTTMAAAAISKQSGAPILKASKAETRRGVALRLSTRDNKDFHPERHWAMGKTTQGSY
jgi:hypothetical protein